MTRLGSLDGRSSSGEERDGGGDVLFAMDINVL